MKMVECLLLVLVGLGVTALSGGSALALDTAGTATTVGRLERVVDVLLRVEADNERGDVDDLLADADVALADEDTSVVDRLGEAELEDLGLETALKEVLGLKGKDVVETHARVVEDTNANKTTDKGVALEEALRVLLVELEELTSRTTDLREGKLNAPDLTLVAETVLAGELNVSITCMYSQSTTEQRVTRVRRAASRTEGIVDDWRLCCAGVAGSRIWSSSISTRASPASEPPSPQRAPQVRPKLVHSVPSLLSAASRLSISARSLAKSVPSAVGSP